ncbi:hypothetical protein FF1_041572 [Malus domestica]
MGRIFGDLQSTESRKGFRRQSAETGEFSAFRLRPVRSSRTGWTWSDPFCCIAGPVGPFLLIRWTGSDKLNRFEPDVGPFLLLRWTGSDKLNRFEPDVPGRTVSAASLNQANRVGQDGPGQIRRTGSDGRTGSDR